MLQKSKKISPETPVKSRVTRNYKKNEKNIKKSVDIFIVSIYNNPCRQERGTKQKALNEDNKIT